MSGTVPGPARHRTRLLVLPGVLSLVLVTIWLVGFSSALGVRTIRVSGEHRVSDSQILDAAGIRHGAPLSRLDTGAIRDRVARIPAVRTVTVHTSYPSTVTITVTERSAVGYRPDVAGVVLVDADNVEFATARSAPAGLPALQVSGDQAKAAAAATVAGALSPAFRTVVGRISVPTTQSITLTLTDGRTVLWGGTDRDTEKATLLPVLVHQPGQYFDVSDPSSVISRGA
ncbi:MAG TPA: FtsQ-type POTRA domain-containing protein [Jatrophihabitans sp.]|nr:FtsQ-type POTRA domain-containing protein [Jatrophihabitans sp.]